MPIVVFGSHWVLKMIERWPVIIQLGGAVLAWTAAQMIIGEDLLAPLFEGGEWFNTVARWGTHAVLICGVLFAGWWTTRRKQHDMSPA